MERRDFVGAMAALFGGVVIAPYLETLIITPAQALWVPIQGQYTCIEDLDKMLKRVFVEPAYASFSAESVLMGPFERVRELERYGGKSVYFKVAHEPYASVTQRWGKRKLGLPEVLVKDPVTGVRIACS